MGSLRDQRQGQMLYRHEHEQMDGQSNESENERMQMLMLTVRNAHQHIRNAMLYCTSPLDSLKLFMYSAIFTVLKVNATVKIKMLPSIHHLTWNLYSVPLSETTWLRNKLLHKHKLYAYSLRQKFVFLLVFKQRK